MTSARRSRFVKDREKRYPGMAEKGRRRVGGGPNGEVNHEVWAAKDEQAGEVTTGRFEGEEREGEGVRSSSPLDRRDWLTIQGQGWLASSSKGCLGSLK